MDGNNSCELPQVPETPTVLCTADLRMLQQAAQIVVNKVNGGTTATRSEVNLASVCEDILARIVKV